MQRWVGDLLVAARWGTIEKFAILERWKPVVPKGIPEYLHSGRTRHNPKDEAKTGSAEALVDGGEDDA